MRLRTSSTPIVDQPIPSREAAAGEPSPAATPVYQHLLKRCPRLLIRRKTLGGHVLNLLILHGRPRRQGVRP